MQWSRIWLGVISLLMVNESMDFNKLMLLLKLTDGNLANYINALEKNKLIKIKKKIIGKKMNTAYTATDRGRREFNDHLRALEKLIRM